MDADLYKHYHDIESDFDEKLYIHFKSTPEKKLIAEIEQLYKSDIKGIWNASSTLNKIAIYSFIVFIVSLGIGFIDKSYQFNNNVIEQVVSSNVFGMICVISFFGIGFGVVWGIVTVER